MFKQESTQGNVRFNQKTIEEFNSFIEETQEKEGIEFQNLREVFFWMVDQIKNGNNQPQTNNLETISPEIREMINIEFDDATPLDSAVSQMINKMNQEPETKIEYKEKELEPGQMLIEFLPNEEELLKEIQSNRFKQVNKLRAQKGKPQAEHPEPFSHIVRKLIFQNKTMYAESYGGQYTGVTRSINWIKH